MFDDARASFIRELNDSESVIFQRENGFFTDEARSAIKREIVHNCIVFIRANMPGLNLKGIDLVMGEELTVFFDGAALSKTDFTGAKLRRVHFTGANLYKTIFHDADLSFAVLCETDLTETIFGNAVMVGIDARKSNLSKLDLSGKDLTEAKFDEAILLETIFNNAILCDVSFDYAKARGAKFVGANLSKASFKKTDLRGADFTEADLFEANFERADLRGAILTDVKNLSREKLFGARINVSQVVELAVACGMLEKKDEYSRKEKFKAALALLFSCGVRIDAVSVLKPLYNYAKKFIQEKWAEHVQAKREQESKPKTRNVLRTPLLLVLAGVSAVWGTMQFFSAWERQINASEQQAIEQAVEHAKLEAVQRGLERNRQAIRAVDEKTGGEIKGLKGKDRRLDKDVSGVKEEIKKVREEKTRDGQGGGRQQERDGQSAPRGSLDSRDHKTRVALMQARAAQARAPQAPVARFTHRVQRRA